MNIRGFLTPPPSRFLSVLPLVGHGRDTLKNQGQCYHEVFHTFLPFSWIYWLIITIPVSLWEYWNDESLPSTMGSSPLPQNNPSIIPSRWFPCDGQGFEPILGGFWKNQKLWLFGSSDRTFKFEIWYFELEKPDAPPWGITDLDFQDAGPNTRRVNFQSNGNVSWQKNGMLW